MLLETFDNLEKAKSCAKKYADNGKRHPGLRGRIYRVYRYNGNYIVARGNSIKDFPCRYGVTWAEYVV